MNDSLLERMLEIRSIETYRQKTVGDRVEVVPAVHNYTMTSSYMYDVIKCKQL
jgi:hypothetical protein